MSYLTVAGHRSMALDMRRNRAYATALEQAVSSQSVVLDVGAGTGIHGLLAARLGARRVYLVEPEDIIFVAEEIVRANCLQDSVRCLHGRVQDVDIPEPVDVIVSVLTGNFLLTEDLLEALFHARDAFLAPGGTLIPSAAIMEAVPVSAPELHEEEIAAWSVPQHGVDLSRARTYAANSVLYRSNVFDAVEQLAAPLALHTVEFGKGGYEGVRADVTYDVTTSGLCHGWVGWFRMRLGDGWLSTSPWDAPLHWTPAFLPLDPPLFFERGVKVNFELDRAPFGDWTWRVRTESSVQEHTTLRAAPLNLSALKKASLDYEPALDGEGLALKYVLSQCNGSTAVEAIARSLHDRYGEQFRTAAESRRFVQRIVKRYVR